MLQASKRGFFYPKYVWIMRDSFFDNWWTETEDKSIINCTNNELKKIVDKMILFRGFPLPEDKATTTDAGIVSLYIVRWLIIACISFYS